ncbi:MAG: class I SAM-dependent methyltransferase [Bacteroidota bacterium]
MVKRIYNAIKNRIFPPVKYDFNKANPLGGNGERVDIQLSEQLNFDNLDVYQRNHIKRYEFAKKHIIEGNTCADWACGTGYGSVLLASKASIVKGADINAEIINKIQERYKNIENVLFETANLLDLTYYNLFDHIISFETIEHFKESDIPLLLAIFNKALKDEGKIIFSTPYMQEKSEDAIKLGFHLTFYIDENKINNWLNAAGFELEGFYYQNYQTHHVLEEIDKKEFILCIAKKKQ